MKLETEADNSACLFRSTESQKGEKAPPGGAPTSGGCSVGSGDGSPSAQASPPPPPMPRSIETTASSSTYSSSSSATDVGAEETPAAAAASGRGAHSQNGSTEEEKQATTNGFHDAYYNNNSSSSINGLCLVPSSSSTSCFVSLNCEHFKFIDEDDDPVEDAATANSEPVVPGSSKRNASNETFSCNGIRSAKLEPEGIGTNGYNNNNSTSSIGDVSYSPNRHMRDHDGQKEMEVSAPPLCDCARLLRERAKAAEMPESQSGSSDDSSKSSSTASDVQRHVLKSVLKKGRSTEKGPKKGRVTFDEAVTLYSDEYDDPQMLALRSASDVVVNCPEVFYMFEPPIEYQDLQPFEPPAEYRDPDTGVATENQNIADDKPESPTTNDSSVMSENTGRNDAPEIESPHPESPDEKADEKEAAGPESVETTKEENECVKTEEEVAEPVVSQPASEDVVKADGEIISESETSDSQEQPEWTDHAEGSEHVLQRFLEAEREFAEDDELNRVFHVLENDLACDEKDDAFDDNFFKKLIGLLTAAEGDVRTQQGEFFTTTDFTVSEDEVGRDTEEDDSSQTHSRTLSEADSDCSVSSQDTIIVRMSEEDVSEQQQQQRRDHHHQAQRHGRLSRQHSESDQSVDAAFASSSDGEGHKDAEQAFETYDEVFNEAAARRLENSIADDLQRQQQQQQLHQAQPKETVTRTQPPRPDVSVNPEDVVHQNSVPATLANTTATTTTGNPTVPPKDTVQDADDSTSSDSRSGEVEECDIKLDDIGYDEEDADDYDEECLRGMVRGNSKIRRIIKKNALQCTLFRSIEARRRQQAGYKYQRPKSPPLSQESLVEQLKWLTTVDDNKEADPAPKFCPKPPDVILSTGSVPLNGNLSRCGSSEGEFPPSAQYRLPVHYVAQPRHVMGPDGKGTYLVPAQQTGYPVHHPPRPQRQWLNPANQRAQVPPHPSYPGPRPVMHPMPSQIPDDRLATVSPVPKDYRDWRVLQRVPDNRDSGHYVPQVAGAFRRCPNGPGNFYPRNVVPEQHGKGSDELEQFVMQGSQRMERIRKRYSVAEEEDDPTFGFARRPSVRGVQNRMPVQYHQPSDSGPDVGAKQIPMYADGQGPMPVRSRAGIPSVEHDTPWCRNPGWRGGDQPQPIYCTPGVNPSQAPLPVHRASVALSELPGCATLPHPKSHSDTRYHSYAENIYSGSQTLPHKRWQNVDPRTCMIPANPAVRPMAPHQLARVPGSGSGQPPVLQVPPHAMSGVTSDERGVPEGASSSPKMSSDSLYHGPLPEVVPVGASHKDDGVIYYSMNV